MTRIIALLCSSLIIHGCSTNTALKQGTFIAPLDGLNIEYTVKGNGPTMVVGHLYSGKIGYEITLKPLEEYFTMVYYSPRGTGNSEAPKTLQEYSYKSLVNEVEMLRQHLGVEKIWIFGHSDQSLVAMQYAVDYPDHINGLILSGTHYIESPETEISIKREFEIQRKVQQQWFRQVCQDLDYKTKYHTNSDSLGRDLTYASIKWWCYDSLTAERVIPVYTEINKVGRRKAIHGKQPFQTEAELNEYSERLYAYQERYNEIEAKTLILQGKFDTNNPPTLVEKLSEQIPNSDLILIDKSGHFPWVEQPEKSISTIKNWIRDSGIIK